MARAASPFHGEQCLLGSLVLACSPPLVISQYLNMLSTISFPFVAGLKEAGCILLLLCCLIAQLEARATLRTFHSEDFTAP